VSSYGRNTFTRGVPCLRPVRCPLYTFAASTCRSAPHLRCRSSLGPRSGCVVPLGASRPCRFQPAEAFPTRGTSGSFETFGTEGRHCSDELLLHDKTHMTQKALAFSSNRHCENSSVWPKLRVSRNRQPDRTWTRLPKVICPQHPPARTAHPPSRATAAGSMRREALLASLSLNPVLSP
jgi:hypothetical protein